MRSPALDSTFSKDDVLLMESEVSPLPPLRALDLPAMATFLQQEGYPAFRARQVFQWVFEKGALDFDCMTNLPKELRAFLASRCTLGGLRHADTIGEPHETQKLLFETADGEWIESVLMRDDGTYNDEADEEPESAPRGSTPPKERLSLCVSSQVGCPLGCIFCMTGHGGFRRHLTVDEILDQVLTARRLTDETEQLSNLVFMGMGEPMLNLRAVIPALRLLTSPQAFKIATRRITVSTAGLVPGIDELARADVGVNLAVSLNATTQKVRDRIMPGVRKWPISELLDACRRFPLAKRRRITFEYVLLRGLNDTPDDLRRLTAMLHGIPCKINLILYNADPALGCTPTPEAEAERFRQALVEAHHTVSLRRSKGQRFKAACGQLAAHARRQADDRNGSET
ncbi:MAG TPA: 23S rRNA (adenine(2503)-C(2))-methyltransferase RlmN, partial [Candidatus Sumerlaeota bacterium]|nr:23S rRNA (adenine(2503)-C(2))-methyltransferase RlmN [Candidatus Sumerlaeota bacterium]